jgi:hypothetical protein
MHDDFAAAFARLCDELKTRITQRVHTAGVTVTEDDIAHHRLAAASLTVRPRGLLKPRGDVLVDRPAACGR